MITKRRVVIIVVIMIIVVLVIRKDRIAARVVPAMPTARSHDYEHVSYRHY